VGGAGGVERAAAGLVGAEEWAGGGGALYPRLPGPGSLRAEGRDTRVVFHGG